jgi:hypothetical protein
MASDKLGHASRRWEVLMAILFRALAVAAAMMAGGTIAGVVAWSWGAEENGWAISVLAGAAGGLALAVALLFWYACRHGQGVMASVLAGAAGTLSLAGILLLLFLRR